jgi:hypothetical protein
MVQHNKEYVVEEASLNELKQLEYDRVADILLELNEA